MGHVLCGRSESTGLFGPHMEQGNMISAFLHHVSMGAKLDQCVKGTGLREGASVI